MAVTAKHSEEFSLVLGGPLYQLYLRTRLARPPLELLRRRLIIFTLLTWLPPCLLSIFAGTAIGGVNVPFFYDIATNVRFLICLPLLIIAEGIIHERIQPMINEFVARGIVPNEALPRFKSTITSALRWRNSLLAEVILLLVTLTIGHYLWSARSALKTATWYAGVANTGSDLTAAGMWYVWISTPIFQFMLIRWFYRWVIWVCFLWQVSRLPLHLIPTHPDRTGGLSFLSDTTAAFAPIVVAQSAALAGTIAGKILFDGASLFAFKAEIVGIVVFLVLFVLGPLCVFAPHLWKTRRLGRMAYGVLASRYVEAFDRKWNVETPDDKEFLGTGDIQSLADMGNSYTIVEKMSPVPFDRDAVIQVIASALLPILPLVLTVIPLEQLVVKLLGALF